MKLSITDKCTKCMECVKESPELFMYVDGKVELVRGNRNMNCDLSIDAINCALMCPTNAIRIEENEYIEYDDEEEDSEQITGIHKITKIREAKNIEISSNGIKSIEGYEDFKLSFDVEGDFEEFGLADINIVLDKEIENKFNYSVYKDYDNEYITLIVEGSGEDMMFSIKGYEVKNG